MNKVVLISIGLCLSQHCTSTLVDLVLTLRCLKQIIREWLDEGDRPTAVIAGYDYIAIGMMHALKEAGLRVPEDMALVGYDDIPRAAYLTPSLSSIHIPIEESCRRTVDLMMKKIDDHYYSEHEDITLLSEYVARESSGGERH